MRNKQEKFFFESARWKYFFGTVAKKGERGKESVAECTVTQKGYFAHGSRKKRCNSRVFTLRPFASRGMRKSEEMKERWDYIEAFTIIQNLEMLLWKKARGRRVFFSEEPVPRPAQKPCEVGQEKEKGDHMRSKERSGEGRGRPLFISWKVLKVGPLFCPKNFIYL